MVEKKIQWFCNSSKKIEGLMPKKTIPFPMKNKNALSVPKIYKAF